MTQQDLIATLSPQARQHVDPASPGPMRMMAAKGLAPLPPRELVIVLCGFTYDENEKFVAAATKSIAELPDKILGPALDAGLPAAALDRLVNSLADRDVLLEKLVTRRDTPDGIISQIAG